MIAMTIQFFLVVVVILFSSLGWVETRIAEAGLNLKAIAEEALATVPQVLGCKFEASLLCVVSE